MFAAPARNFDGKVRHSPRDRAVAGGLRLPGKRCRATCCAHSQHQERGGLECRQSGARLQPERPDWPGQSSWWGAEPI